MFKQLIGTGFLVILALASVVAMIIGLILSPFMLILGYFVRRYYSRKIEVKK